MLLFQQELLLFRRLAVDDTQWRFKSSGRVQRIDWDDPLAQSILLDQAAFVTSVDLYFTSKDAAIPVHVSDT